MNKSIHRQRKRGGLRLEAGQSVFGNHGCVEKDHGRHVVVNIVDDAMGGLEPHGMFSVKVVKSGAIHGSVLEKASQLKTLISQSSSCISESGEVARDLKARLWMICREWILRSQREGDRPFPNLYSRGKFTRSISRPTLKTVMEEGTAYWVNTFLFDVATGKEKAPKGIRPDTVGINLFKRLLELDFNKGFAALRGLFRPCAEYTFAPGHFQLSLMGAFNARLSVLEEVPAKVASWIWRELDNLRMGYLSGIGERYQFIGLQASLLAAGVIAEDNEEGLSHIDRELETSLAGLESEGEKVFFLKMVTDFLNRELASLRHDSHDLKLFAVFKYAKAWPSAIRPNNQLFQAVEERFRKARQLLI